MSDDSTFDLGKFAKDMIEGVAETVEKTVDQVVPDAPVDMDVVRSQGGTMGSTYAKEAFEPLEGVSQVLPESRANYAGAGDQPNLLGHNLYGMESASGEVGSFGDRPADEVVRDFKETFWDSYEDAAEVEMMRRLKDPDDKFEPPPSPADDSGGWFDADAPSRLLETINDTVSDTVPGFVSDLFVEKDISDIADEVRFEPEQKFDGLTSEGDADALQPHWKINFPIRRVEDADGLLDADQQLDGLKLDGLKDDGLIDDRYTPEGLKLDGLKDDGTADMPFKYDVPDRLKYDGGDDEQSKLDGLKLDGLKLDGLKDDGLIDDRYTPEGLKLDGLKDDGTADMPFKYDVPDRLKYDGGDDEQSKLDGLKLDGLKDDGLDATSPDGAVEDAAMTSFIPDVVVTPSPAGPVPIPYPNVSESPRDVASEPAEATPINPSDVIRPVEVQEAEFQPVEVDFDPVDHDAVDAVWSGITDDSGDESSGDYLTAEWGE